ncbi:hypothetical protein [Mycolicibacterium austroafricanum]|uniref:hypothetical protein n=1 Tax=Mycolicibacterium austroafricanum TaxID=39687 RepID=UPI001CA3584D|nr:hypothetical protein [Mycolicibacterium austroafricanum]QZT61233.1 hypothetical protein JN085_19900 [Mycolicibacterium austroafricanum]
MIGPWVLTDAFRAKLADEGLRTSTASWKVALFLSTSNLSVASTTYAGVTAEHANGNGYTTGGVAVTLAVTGSTTVTVSLSAVPEFTASGGSIVARWAALYEVADDVAAFCLLDDTPADVTVLSGSTFELDSTDVFVIS